MLEDLTSNEKIFAAVIIVSLIILIYIYSTNRALLEGFELETAVTPAYIRNYYTKKLADTLSEDPRNSAGEYVEFFTVCDNNDGIFDITPDNCVFKYNHMNDKTFTIQLPLGIYSGPELAKKLECELNAVDDGWWVTWDSMHKRFAMGTHGFKYRRWYHPRSIYADMGIKCTPEFGLMKNMTEWMDSEIGESIVFIRSNEIAMV